MIVLLTEVTATIFTNMDGCRNNCAEEALPGQGMVGGPFYLTRYMLGAGQPNQFPCFPAPKLKLHVKLSVEIYVLKSHCHKLTSSQVVLLCFGGMVSTCRARAMPLAKHRWDSVVFNKDA